MRPILPMLALAVLCLGLLGQVDAHGTLSIPRSRNVQYFQALGSAW
jgi:predicted carbohydrate-binding protein with CBM5 and CBM33 domain